MENQIIGTDSEYCGCETEWQCVVFIPTEDGKGKTIGGEPFEESPDLCEICGKPSPEYIPRVIEPREVSQI